MSNKHYVICENECLVEGMTKEEILSTIANATGKAAIPVNDAFISMVVNQNDGNNLKLWRGTKAEYNNIAKKDSDTVYIVTDETPEQVAKTVAEATVEKVMDNYLIKSDVTSIERVSALPSSPNPTTLYIIV